MSQKKSTVFITGGAGFIGSHLTERLIEKGYIIKIFDNLHRNSIKYTDIAKNNSVKFVQGSVLDAALLKKEMKGADIVLHLAAIAGVSNYHNFPALTLKTNLIGTYNLLEGIVENKIKRMVDLSTSEIFGSEVIGVNEESFFNIGPPQDKRWSYAASKIGGEQLTHRYAEEHKFEATIIRPFNIYGPRQTGEGAISNFCKNILAKKKIKLEGDGSGIRSWCYVDDFVDALLKIIEKPHKSIEAYNVGNPWTSVSNYALAEITIRAAKKNKVVVPNSFIEFVPMKYTDIKVRYPDISKIKKSYNWSPKIQLEEGMERTFKWFLENYEEKN